MEEIMKGVDAEKLKELKAKHGKVFLIVVDADGEAVKGIFCKPSIKILSLVAKKAQEGDTVAAAISMYKNCKLIVEPAMEASEEIQLSAAKKANDLFKKFDAEAKEL